MNIEDEVKLKQGGAREIYQVPPPMAREDMAAMRKRCGMLPATFNYSDPTPEMQIDALWNAIWNEIKTWDINVPTEYRGYSGATGNHVTAIYLAILGHLDLKLESLVLQLANERK